VEQRDRELPPRVPFFLGNLYARQLGSSAKLLATCHVLRSCAIMVAGSA